MIGRTNAVSKPGVELSLVVSVTSGAAVTATKGSKTVNGTAAGGSCTGKWCPRPWMGDDMNAYYGTSGNEQWARFKARLSGNEEVFDMDINEARKQLTSCADTGDTPSAWAKEAAEYCKRKGIFNGDGAGNFGWQQPITREAVACIIYRALEAAGALGNLSDV